MKKTSSARKPLRTKKAPPAKKASPVMKALPWIVAAVAVVVIGVLMLRPSANTGGGIRNVDSAGLEQAQKNGAQIIDVRTAGEYATGHIQGSVNIPIDQLQGEAAKWDRDGNYVLYCATGERSLAGQKEMEALGFKNVANLTGGIVAWTGGQLEKGQTTSEQTIPTSGKPVFIEFYTPT